MIFPLKRNFRSRFRKFFSEGPKFSRIKFSRPDKNPRNPRNFSPSKILGYTVFHIPYLSSENGNLRKDACSQVVFGGEPERAPHKREVRAVGLSVRTFMTRKYTRTRFKAGLVHWFVHQHSTNM